MALVQKKRRWLSMQIAAAVLAATVSATAEVRVPVVPADEPILIAAAKKTDSKSSKKSSSKKTSKSDSSSSKKESSKPKATPAPPPPPLTTETLPQELEKILETAGKRSDWGVKILHAEAGQPLFGREDNQHFIPASNRKVFTGALALDQLGPDYKFRTYVYRTGNVDESGTLQGNLVILAQGDPTFSNRGTNGKKSTDWIYRDFVQKVKDAGIKQISGDILIDASDWVWNDLAPRGWPERLIQDNYAVPPGPLTLNENVIGIKVRPTTAGEPPKIEFFPPAEGYPVECTAITGKNGRARIVKPPTGPIQISGTVGQVTEDAKPCDNSTLFAAAVFRQRLREAGVHLGGTARIVTRKGVVPQPTSDTVVAVYESPTMAEMVKTMMKSSNNHYAEQLFVAVSAAKTGRGGYTESRRLENELLQKAGVDVGNLQFGDGSGLSEANQVTPEQVTKLLAYMLNHPHAQAFVDSMAIGGVDGTLRGRMHSSELKGKVYGKTGFINGVSALSGYYFKEPGQTYVFSFLVNDIPGGPSGAKSAQERLLQTLSRMQ